MEIVPRRGQCVAVLWCPSKDNPHHTERVFISCRQRRSEFWARFDPPFLSVDVTKPNLQEILCCLGQPPGAIPFQYVLGKAFAAAELDWRFLTLDVSTDALGAAISGMEAMGFCGGILYEPHDAQAIEYLDQATQLAKRTRQVDLIYRQAGEEGEQLIGDSTVGKICLDAIEEICPLAEHAVVVVGNSLTSRTAALSACDRVHKLVVVSEDAEFDRKLLEIWDGLKESSETEIAEIEMMSASELGDLEHPPKAIIQGNRNTADVVIDPTVWGPDVIFADLGINPPRTDIGNAAADAGCHVIDGLDLLLLRLAGAFRVWSNTEPDQRVMRESLEEYLMV